MLSIIPSSPLDSNLLALPFHFARSGLGEGCPDSRAGTGVEGSVMAEWLMTQFYTGTLQLKGY